MSVTKTLILSPYFHPQQDGLGQYSKNFYLELSSRENQEVHVLTSKIYETDEQVRSWKNIHPIIELWGFKQIFEIIKQVKKLNPHILLVQYVPFMFAKKGGINFMLPFLLIYLRLTTRIKIHHMFHEINYPLLPDFKAIIMFFCHNLIFYLISFASHKIFVSTEYFKQLVQRRLLFLKEANLLPVGSNIASPSGLPKTKIKNLICFGSLHPSKGLNLVLPKLIDFAANQEQLNIVIVGPEKSNVLKQLDRETEQKAKGLLSIPGFLSDGDLTELYFQGSAAICYFVDGISCRRGSALAALQHGIPLVSTKTNRTSDLFKDKWFIDLCREDIFLNNLDRLKSFLDNLKSSYNPEEIINFYRQNFAWNIIVDRYLELSKQD